jgi:hypothetical protein
VGLIIAVGTLMALIALWVIISPKSWWELFHSWRYRDPRANEPSDAA